MGAALSAYRASAGFDGNVSTSISMSTKEPSLRSGVSVDVDVNPTIG
jgi:hypothetical protein